MFRLKTDDIESFIRIREHNLYWHDQLKKTVNDPLIIRRSAYYNNLYSVRNHASYFSRKTLLNFRRWADQNIHVPVHILSQRLIERIKSNSLQFNRDAIVHNQFSNKIRLYKDLTYNKITKLIDGDILYTVEQNLTKLGNFNYKRIYHNIVEISCQTFGKIHASSQAKSGSKL